MDLHVLLWQLAAGGLQAASALGHRRLLTVVQLLQAGVSVGRRAARVTFSDAALEANSELAYVFFCAQVRRSRSSVCRLRPDSAFFHTGKT